MSVPHKSEFLGEISAYPLQPVPQLYPSMGPIPVSVAAEVQR